LVDDAPAEALNAADRGKSTVGNALGQLGVEDFVRKDPGRRHPDRDGDPNDRRKADDDE
jgi:hypothetical protein